MSAAQRQALFEECGGDEPLGSRLAHVVHVIALADNLTLSAMRSTVSAIRGYEQEQVLLREQNLSHADKP